jgi:hypothetical protein
LGLEAVSHAAGECAENGEGAQGSERAAVDEEDWFLEDSGHGGRMVSRRARECGIEGAIEGVMEGAGGGMQWSWLWCGGE